MKKALILYLLLSVIIQIPFVKKIISFASVNSLYIPVLYTISYAEELKQSREEKRALEKKLSVLLYNKGKLKSESDTANIATLISYTPFGFPDMMYLFPAKGNPGYLVLWHGYLCGRISGTRKASTQALTIYNELFRIGARIRRYNGILEGGIYPLVDYIPIEYKIEKGDTVYTSGIGDNHIADIPIGTVRYIRKDPLTPFFHKITVQPFFNIHRIKTVCIIPNE